MLSDIETQFRHLTPNSKINLTITASKKEIWDAFKQYEPIAKRLYKPMEFSHTHPFYWFQYIHPQRSFITICVKSEDIPISLQTQS